MTFLYCNAVPQLGSCRCTLKHVIIVEWKGVKKRTLTQLSPNTKPIPHSTSVHVLSSILCYHHKYLVDCRYASGLDCLNYMTIYDYIYDCIWLYICNTCGLDFYQAAWNCFSCDCRPNQLFFVRVFILIFLLLVIVTCSFSILVYLCKMLWCISAANKYSEFWVL